jgi:hypothetical protein
MGRICHANFLCLGHGSIKYVHAGYGSKYERDLFLDIERGVVKNTRVRHNGTAEAQNAREGYQIGAMTIFPRGKKDDGDAS